MSDNSQEEKQQNLELGKPYLGKTIRFFVSYSTGDKLIAAKIKELLETYGFEVFLAHEDIRPSEDWQDTILQNLESTDIFVPLITSKFKESFWTDQESGYALARGKKIIPITLNGSMPYGFVASIQAVKCEVKNLETDLLTPCKKVIDEVKKDSKFRDSFIDSIVRAFEGSYSFDSASSLATELGGIEDFTPEQINQIAKSSLENSQIKNSYGARPRVKELIKRFQDLVSPEVLKKFYIEYSPEEIKEEDDDEEEEIPF